jgi:hypothetical protein
VLAASAAQAQDVIDVIDVTGNINMLLVSRGGNIAAQNA